MKKVTLLWISCFLIGSILGATQGIQQAKAKKQPVEVRTNIINTKGAKIGTVTLTQYGAHVQMRIEAKQLSPGKHGIHFHETGLCDPPGFTTAGAHFNPEHHQHGFNNTKGYHAGDLPNIEADRHGKVNVYLLTSSVTLDKGKSNSLLKLGGTSIIIHADADDYQTDPAGNSGARIACAAIK